MINLIESIGYFLFCLWYISKEIIKYGIAQDSTYNQIAEDLIIEDK